VTVQTGTPAPTSIVATCVADTYVQLADGVTPNPTPFGTEAYFYTDGSRTHAIPSTLRDALLRFEGLPASAARRATLRLYCTEERYPTNRPGRLDVRAALVPWTESEATWSNSSAGVVWPGGPFETGPGVNYGTNVYATKAALDSESWSGAWVELEVTALVNEWVSGARANHGLVVQSYSGTGGDKRFTFTSREGVNKPELVCEMPTGARPRISAFVCRGGGVNEVGWGAVPGTVYRMEYTTNLLSKNWILMRTCTAVTDTVTLDDTTAGAAPRRFYRVVEQ
jgi:hypothetical protein